VGVLVAAVGAVEPAVQHRSRPRSAGHRLAHHSAMDFRARSGTEPAEPDDPVRHARTSLERPRAGNTALTMELDTVAGHRTAELQGCDGPGQSTLAARLATGYGFAVVHSGRTEDGVHLVRPNLARNSPMLPSTCSPWPR
jgi:hypothetical protein